MVPYRENDAEPVPDYRVFLHSLDIFGGQGLFPDAEAQCSQLQTPLIELTFSF